MSDVLQAITRLCFAVLCGFALNAATASEPIEVARGIAPQYPQQPQLAVDAKGSIHVVFGVGDIIRYCRSEDSGRSFSSPASLPSVHDMSLGMRRGPRLAVTATAVCVTAVGGKQGKARDGDVLALRSIDGGKTWSEPVLDNDTEDSALIRNAQRGLMRAIENGSIVDRVLEI